MTETAVETGSFTHPVTVTVNGAARSVEIEHRLLLVHFLRETLGLTGTHVGCDTTSCGACTILAGRHAREVLHDVRRPGGRVRGDDRRGPGLRRGAHPMQEGFHEEHGLQCGFCTPGMMLTATALLAENPDPSEEDIRWAICGNICRCTGYQNIVKAVQYAAAKGKEARCRATEEIRGVGHSVKRFEDARFIRGKGNYFDDITLPGMLHLEFLRSPYAHARITSIDTSRAAAVEGVVAVVTGELLAQHNLAWMPTLSGDTQAVLATDKVRFQGQEVAAVIAESAYIAKDACELIDVDYEPLQAITSPQQALEEGAPVIRDEKEGQTDNHIYDWEAGDKEATDKAFADADKVVELDTFYPRCHPAPLECCGCVADVNPATGKATIYMTSQAPHVHRTLFALVAGLPEQKIRIVSPDLGGGFGNKVPIYPGYVVATAASLLIGRPVKWVEDRTGNLISTGFARDYHMHGELALKGREDHRPAREDALRQRCLLLRRAADEVQGRPLPHRHRLLRHPGRPRRDDGRVHEQGAGRRRLPLLVPRHRGLVPDRAPRPDRRLRDRGRPGRASGGRTSSSRSSSPTSRPPGSSTTRATTGRPWTSRSRSSATRTFDASRPRHGPRAGCSASASPPSRRSSAPGTGPSTRSRACA